MVVKATPSGVKGPRQPADTADMEQLLTPEQTSDFLQIPEATLAVWRHRSSGPPWIKLGRHVRYRREALLRWLEGETVIPGRS